MPETAPSRVVVAPRSSAALWLIAILLAFIAGLLWTRSDGLLPAALAQNTPLSGSRGIYAFTGQIDQNRYGLFMLDIEQGTIWCYEMDHVGGARKLRLTAARTWIYDRYLKDFNCAEPSFRDVQDLVAQQRAQSAAAAAEDPANDGRTALPPDAPPSKKPD